MLRGSPYGSVERITPLCKPATNHIFALKQCYKVNDRALSQEGWVLTKFFSGPSRGFSLAWLLRRYRLRSLRSRF